MEAADGGGGAGAAAFRFGTSLAEVAESLGSSEQALRLILSILMGG